jgi:pyrimidine-nucleoside phosphorylase/thymidine phosphorylase
VAEQTNEVGAEDLGSALGGPVVDARAAIRKKRDGGTHGADEILALTAGFTRGRIPDYQIAAWLMAVYFQGLDAEETLALTQAMLHSGELISLPGLSGPTVDKHSTGGVGDKISLALAPIVAACGAFVPMISGRGLGHTGGTLDKLEAIPGMRVQLGTEEFRKLVRAHGLAFGSQTSDIAPADRLLYALRDVTATVECIPLIVASILSKKFASGTKRVVFDVKAGRGAFMRDMTKARELAGQLLEVTRGLGFEGTALITNMDQPLGKNIGNALEVAEAVDVLHGGGPEDVRELTYKLAGEMLALAGLSASFEEGEKSARMAVSGGKAYAKFQEIVEAQGGDPRYVIDPSQLPKSPRVHMVESPREGYVTALDAFEVGEIVVHLGGGRLKKDDKVDPSVGVVLLKKVGDRVQAGEPLASIHARDAAQEAIHALARAYRIGDEPPKRTRLLLERLQAPPAAV